jgi:hypothetical protein
VVHLGLFSLLGSTMMADGATDCGANNSMAPGRSCQTSRFSFCGRAQSSANRENYQMPLHHLAPKDAISAVSNHSRGPRFHGF